MFVVEMVRRVLIAPEYQTAQTPTIVAMCAAPTPIRCVAPHVPIAVVCAMVQLLYVLDFSSFFLQFHGKKISLTKKKTLRHSLV